MSKDSIANDMYGCDFEDLSGAEKAAVTRRYNAQHSTPAPRAVVADDGVEVTIARIGNGPSQTFVLHEGSTVGDLLRKAGLSLDAAREAVLARGSGDVVATNDALTDGETYVLAPAVKSA